MFEKQNHLPILYFHSVAPSKRHEWNKSYLTYELVYFEDLLKHLNLKKYEFLFLDELMYRKSDPAAKNKKMICLTFDDGYLDNYVFVFPLLKKYNAVGTIFVSPLYVHDNEYVHPTLEDVWSGKMKQKDLKSMGFLSWGELKILEESGVMDIQSHTMTHTKYYSSDILREFHHPNANYLYPISNLYPDQLPYYITNPSFKNLVPFGTPFFEETSSIICRRVFINNEFEKECVDMLTDSDWGNYRFQNCFDKIKHLYDGYKSRDKLISKTEQENEYKLRVQYEIIESKRNLESKLNKSINHICWPHGDYNTYCHDTAMKEGYKSSLSVPRFGQNNLSKDRFDRIGTSTVWQNRYLSLWKTRYKVGSYRNQFPYNLINSTYNLLRYVK